MDELVGWPTNTHTISKTIKASKIEAKNIFNQKILNKYSGMEFWRG